MEIPKTELVKLSKIKRNPNNPRVIKDGKYHKLVKSINELPQMLAIRPIVVNDDMVVLGGNMRLKACGEAGLKEVPVLKASQLTEEQQKEFIVKDNVGFGDWDWDMLANEWDMEELNDWGLDIPDMFEEEPEETTGDDEAPEPEDDPETVVGDLWELGPHRLLCGDSTSVDAVEMLMDGRKADMVFTDPPYGMFLNTDYSKMGGNGSMTGKTGKKYDQVIGDHEDFSPELINTIFSCFGYCKEVFLWGADYYAELLPNKNSGSWVVWDKRIEESTDKMYGSTFELCWSKARHKRLMARIKWAGMFGMGAEHDKGRQHPTQKPVGLAAYFLKQWGKDVKCVVDIYGGSGSTLLACEKTRRECQMMELDPKYCDTIVKRYVQFCEKNGRPWSVKLNGEGYEGRLTDAKNE